MPMYHRILSYLYRYDKKDKLDCKGFVKAEQKKDGLKLTLQVEDEHLTEAMKFVLCFYCWQDGWKIIPVENLTLTNHQEETIFFYPASRLPEGFDVRKQSGILLFYQEFFYYGTVWIGEEVPITSLMENDHAGVLTGQTVPTGGKEAMETSMSEENHSTEEKHSTEDESRAEEDFVVEKKTVSGEEAAEGKNVLSEKEEALTENPGGHLPEETGKETENNLQEEFREEPAEEVWIKTEEVSTTEEDWLERLWIRAEKKIKNVNNIFNPAFRGGYQLQPEQLQCFCPEAERLAENQFLRTGCRSYGHVLVGKVIYGGKERYCVGVPGVYGNRERYMAQIYQFPIFLAMTENRIKTGGFGYWLHLLEEEKGKES